MLSLTYNLKKILGVVGPLLLLVVGIYLLGSLCVVALLGVVFDVLLLWWTDF